jgi:hypothetical protein
LASWLMLRMRLVTNHQISAWRESTGNGAGGKGTEAKAKRPPVQTASAGKGRPQKQGRSP